MDAATIEETNRIRVSLGMKPLPVPGASASNPDKSSVSDREDAASTLESRQAQSYDNYKKHQDAEAAKQKREDRAAAIRKARDEAQRFALLEGKGLGDADDKEDTDAKSWLMGQKKRQKKIDKARKLEEELAAAEAEAAAAVQYTSKDLAGIKVAHDTSEFLGGDDQILTLKDTTIDENEDEGDELENLSMREQAQLNERLDLKKKQHGYNPNDDEEGQGGILSQYDDEIHGKKGKKFTLDASGSIAELADILGEPAQKANSASVNLDDIIGHAPMSSDYLAPSEIKVKKPKKKKSKGTRQKQYDDDDIFPLDPAPADSSAMDVDSKEAAAASKKRKAESDSFVDDDDLQASLALQRKAALKKRKKVKPEDIAKQLKEEKSPSHEDSNDTQDGGFVIGEISEFVSNLSKRDEEEERKPKRSRTQTRSPDADEDHPMDNGHNEQPPVTEDGQEHESTTRRDAEADAVIEEEKNVGEGMGAALALLRERGLIEQTQGEEYDSIRHREEFLSRKRLLEEELDEQTRQQRERDRMSGRLDRMSVREREDWARQQNQWRDQQQSRRMAELFSANYKPKVNLTYTDDHGRSLDQKEAFKHLSHQFHGKGSGKGKTEKRLKKIGDEMRREAQSLFDASANGGMSAATVQQLKKRREAGVRLG
ncbi:hypothetical protein QQS21_005099 [Conoideocrella luteorostrata]|uniref:SART-1 protein n=1 Tax=Conoideocrella luteorostrata TaxID=1105319 RepID=A0AAJ0CR40_9HYPO|nr:hypothetical protein QQS21_005099 [Conoideocrella luteorostrata]